MAESGQKKRAADESATTEGEGAALVQKKDPEPAAVTPEPVRLSLERIVSEAPLRFGVEPFVAAGALAGQARGETMSLDRAEGLIKDFLKQEHSMEVEA